MSRLHADEITLTADQAAAHVAQVFPQFSGRPLHRVASAGTDNTLFRIGSDHCLRLPRRPEAGQTLLREAAILPGLGALPLQTPQCLSLADGTEAFPWPSAVFGWIAGAAADGQELRDEVRHACALGEFVRQSRSIEAGHIPPAGPGNHFRGTALSTRDDPLRRACANLDDLYDTNALLKIWERALAMPSHAGPPNLVHGDLHPGNLLMREGRLAAVIDWGLSGAGDPAVDGTPAWSVFSGPARAAFLEAAELDRPAVVRAKAWALSIAAIALAYYRNSHPPLARQSRITIEAVLDDDVFPLA